MYHPEIELVRDTAREKLVLAGVPDAEGDIEQLIYHFLQNSGDDSLARFIDAVESRSKRIPLGYILGYAEFDGLNFIVGAGTFVPRTQSLPMINALCSRISSPVEKITDLCAGVGPLGISLMLRLSSSRVYFVEYNKTAIGYLKKNIKNLVPSNTQIHILENDIFSVDDFLSPAKLSDIVIANPPFVPNGRASLPEFSQHHPQDAIFSGEDGSIAVRRCCLLTKKILRRHGIMGIEHHETHADIVRDILATLDFRDIRQIADSDGKMRITTALNS
ncbi:N5-glutamine methyltransferase family protein [Photorhabdus laumondii]|uniref:Methyltransferase small domain-containing protein n=1 Tax=Photorhabdus laumondii subsp. clarkei TaxID=2029685 RepID=A0A329VCH2_9GAMM|nr:methyltransferase [Photorhabdus laumondii]RAW86915.1 hypothetical protein CKY01_17560 [Photorhabdus laumondii subsp. clarkei]